MTWPCKLKLNCHYYFLSNSHTLIEMPIYGNAYILATIAEINLKNAAHKHKKKLKSLKG